MNIVRAERYCVVPTTDRFVTGKADTAGNLILERNPVELEAGALIDIADTAMAETLLSTQAVRPATVDALTLSLLHVSPTAVSLEAALAGALAGARVFPVEPDSHGGWRVMRISAGPGRDGWDLASRDPETVRRLWAEWPSAIPGFIVQTPFGFSQRWAWRRGALLPIVEATVFSRS